MVSPLQGMLGETLVSREGEVPTASLAGPGRFVGLYFSAHWCPPCRGFTPMLKAFYEAHAESSNFEIVFVSSDKSDAEFEKYYAGMPWKALPFHKRDIKDRISKKLKVWGYGRGLHGGESRVQEGAPRSTPPF